MFESLFKPNWVVLYRDNRSSVAIGPKLSKSEATALALGSNQYSQCIGIKKVAGLFQRTIPLDRLRNTGNVKQTNLVAGGDIVGRDLISNR